MEGEKRAAIDAATKLNIYLLILNRYKDLIKEKESKTISEIRQLVSPYNNESLKKLKDELTSEISNYSYEKNFYMAMDKAMAYVKRIRTCEFAIPFWMSFDEIREFGITDAMNKSVLFAALMRSFGSENVKVVVTKKAKPYVRFEWGGDNYLFVPETGSLLQNEDVRRLFESDPASYAFSDLSYENYEEE
ncbi:hypothetical protein H0O02_01820 [Candidatus Micrarchaeota archaeon]|nr:hypothetical protein [Candidatus Micrarchaeota archaeon]